MVVVIFFLELQINDANQTPLTFMYTMNCRQYKFCSVLWNKPNRLRLLLLFETKKLLMED